MSRTAPKILPPVQAKRLPIPCAGNWRARGPSEPRLPCRRNDDFLQKVRSRLRKMILFETWSLLGWPWGGPGGRDSHARAALCRAESGMATHLPLLPCKQDDYFLQTVRSRLRKTILSGIGLRKASPSKTEPGQPGTNASRTAKKIVPPVQVKR